MTAVPIACEACREDRPLFPIAMAFQPIVDLFDRRIVAHEALVRGPAGEPAAQVLAQVTDANRYAFDQACRVTAIETAARLGMRTRLNINFLPNAVYEPRACIRRTLEAAERTGFPLDRLTFEFIENERVDDAHLHSIIEAYRRHGFSVALDDYGVGYSNLGRLVEIRPDIIKVDRALVRGCDEDRMRRAILSGLVGFTREMDIKLVAEGVERAEEARVLREIGLRFAQGFLFARPMFQGLAREEDIAWGD
ncbi:EAL domain-containing protein [Roseococcus sp. SYP-B2431]|uniref:EAL domain-containing protein n=1 Tax=Roseococcus sp. SYP-B2431 TaxID=2496640 RepID=UPI001039D735|nr:EAL domain-containing protein [Roseococcus sp. SYP-B2431]TCH96739.1 EAL domain-containing protein [Roseococcus sp. SYP-B2431]